MGCVLPQKRTHLIITVCQLPGGKVFLFLSGSATLNIYQSVLHGVPGKEMEPEVPDMQLHFFLCCNIK